VVSKFLADKDIRKEGSGNAGARNAGRLYGQKAFIFTFFGDALKGAFIVYLGRFLDYSTSILLLGLLFTCAGHIKPIFFQWKGGKGNFCLYRRNDCHTAYFYLHHFSKFSSLLPYL